MGEAALEPIGRLTEAQAAQLAGCSSRGGRQAFARALTDGACQPLIPVVILALPAAGRALLKGVVEQPQLSGVRRLPLYGPPELVPFYRRCRFTETDGVGIFALAAGDRAR